MHKTLRPFAKRLGVSTEQAMRDFLYDLGNALATVETEKNAVRFENERDTIFETPADFMRVHCDVDPRKMYGAELLAIILQSTPGSKFYMAPDMARKHTASYGKNFRYSLGLFMWDLIKDGQFECFLCHDKGTVLAQSKMQCTSVRDQDHSRVFGYGTKWFLATTYGGQTALCRKCYSSITDEFGNVDNEKEVKAVARVVRQIAKDRKSK